MTLYAPKISHKGPRILTYII
jgi:coatomer subunit beta